MELDIKITHQEEKYCIDMGYRYLGWQVYSGNCEELKKCYELGHKTREVSHNNRGTDHTCWCNECKIWWKIDSSD